MVFLDDWTINRFIGQKALLPKKLDDIDEMDKFLETHKLPKWTQEDIKNLNRPISSKEIESMVKNSQQRKYSSKWGHQKFQQEQLGTKKIRKESQIQSKT